jgi:uncharacterized sulfatase
LKQGGYATGHFGKWHLGGGRDVGEAPLPTEYGFDASLTQFEGLGDRVLPLMSAQGDKPERKLPLGAASEKLGRGQVAGSKRSDVTKAFVDGALAFIQRAERDNKPFYVNLWPDDVHSPFDPPERRRGDGSKRALYHGVLETMDEQLGPLFEAIRRSPRLRDNTLIIFASDNGPEPGAGSAGPFRGAKATLYEGGVREPFIVWGPGPRSRRQTGNRQHHQRLFRHRRGPVAARFGRRHSPSRRQLRRRKPGPNADRPRLGHAHAAAVLEAPAGPSRTARRAAARLRRA